MWKRLGSRKLALGLILLLAIETALAMFIPQKGLTDPVFQRWAWENPGLAPLVKALQWNNFFGSPLFLLTVAVFWLNTLVCTFDQGKRAWRNFRVLKFKFKNHPLLTGSYGKEAASVAEQIALLLAARRYRTNILCTERETRVVAYRNRWGLWGMTIFHISLLWIISASALGQAFGVEGNAIIAEDLSFFERHQDYTHVQEGALFREGHRGFEVLVNQVMLKFRGNKAPELDRAVLAIRENGQEVKKLTLFFRDIVEYNGYKLQLGRRGYTPVLRVDDGSGVPMLNYLSLDVQPAPRGGETYRQKVFIRDLGQEVDLWFFPSPPDRLKRNLAYHVDRPQLEISYVDTGGRKQSKTIGLNQTIELGGKRVTLVGVKLWVELFISKYPGANLVFLAFALALAGLALHYGLPYRQLSFVFSGDGKLAVYGYSRLYPVAFNSGILKLVMGLAPAGSLQFDHRAGEEEDIW